MPKAYPLDLRERVARFVESGRIDPHGAFLIPASEK
jgi:hypothetical protein